MIATLQSRVPVFHVMAIFATTQVSAALQSRTLMLWLALSAILVGTNWTVYIFAVNTGRVLESSLGAPTARIGSLATPCRCCRSERCSRRLFIATTGR